LFADLALVFSVWPTLPEALRAAVMALVRTHAEGLSTNGRTAEVAAAIPNAQSLVGKTLQLVITAIRPTKTQRMRFVVKGLVPAK
jgi:hypothetical protein